MLAHQLKKIDANFFIVTMKDARSFSNISFDKILVDAPSSGEGTLRKSPKTFLMWNENMIKKIASTQRQ